MNLDLIIDFYAEHNLMAWGVGFLAAAFVITLVFKDVVGRWRFRKDVDKHRFKSHKDNTYDLRKKRAEDM